MSDHTYLTRVLNQFVYAKVADPKQDYGIEHFDQDQRTPADGFTQRTLEPIVPQGEESLARSYPALDKRAVDQRDFLVIMCYLKIFTTQGEDLFKILVSALGFVDTRIAVGNDEVGYHRLFKFISRLRGYEYQLFIDPKTRKITEIAKITGLLKQSLMTSVLGVTVMLQDIYLSGINEAQIKDGVEMNALDLPPEYRAIVTSYAPVLSNVPNITAPVDEKIRIITENTDVTPDEFEYQQLKHQSELMDQQLQEGKRRIIWNLAWGLIFTLITIWIISQLF